MQQQLYYVLERNFSCERCLYKYKHVQCEGSMTQLPAKTTTVGTKRTQLIYTTRKHYYNYNKYTSRTHYTTTSNQLEKCARLLKHILLLCNEGNLKHNQHIISILINEC